MLRKITFYFSFILIVWENMKGRKSLLHLTPYAMIFQIVFWTEWLRPSSTSIIHNLTKFFLLLDYRCKRKSNVEERKLWRFPFSIYSFFLFIFQHAVFFCTFVFSCSRIFLGTGFPLGDVTKKKKGTMKRFLKCTGCTSRPYCSVLLL